MTYSTKYLYGFSKTWIDLILFCRLLFQAIKHWGIIHGIKELKTYFKHEACLFNTRINRYIKVNKHIFAVPDMPPLNSPDFIKVLLKDIQYINHKVHSGFLFSIFCISSRCPYKCEYCYNSDMHSDKELLSLEQIINSIDQIIESGVYHIYLSGGEPMMRYHDVLGILDTFKDSPVNFWLLTTGWQMTKEKIKTLKNNGLKGIMVSFDSDEKEYIHSIKKNNSSYEQALNTLKWSSQNGLLTVVDCVMNKALLEQDRFDRFMDKISESGAHFINCYAPKNANQKSSSPEIIFNLSDFKMLEKLIDANHIENKNFNVPVAYSPDLWESKRGCTGGKLFFYIDPAGNIKSCPFKNEMRGNIKTDTIISILSHLKNNPSDQTCQTVHLLQKSLNKTSN